jgi:two-component system response regulator DevR
VYRDGRTTCWTSVDLPQPGDLDTTIVLAFRRAAIADALALALEQGGAGQVVAITRTVAETAEAVRGSSPDAVILSLFDTDEEERAAAWTLRQVDPGIRLVVLHRGSEVPRSPTEATTYLPSQTDLEGLLETVRRRHALQARAEPTPDLSPSEQRVAALVAEGYPNRRIAEQLHLSERTVRNYVSNILGKLGLGNRTELALVVSRDGLHRE